MKLLYKNWRRFLMGELICNFVSYDRMKQAWDKYTNSKDPGIPVLAIIEAKKIGINLK